MRSIPVARPAVPDEFVATSPDELLPPAQVLDPASACRLLRAHPRGGTEFWAAARVAGTPLVDELTDDPDHRAVTFVHQADADLRAVNVLVRSIVEPEHFDISTMRLLPGSDVWATTLRLDARWRGSYSIAATEDGQPPAPVDEWIASRLLEGSDSSMRPTVERYLRAFSIAQPDPLAAHHRPGGYSFMSLPAAPPLRWIPDTTTDDPDVERGGEGRGVVHDTLPDGREVWRFEPADADPAQPLPVVVFLDGASWSIDGPAMIAGMSAEGLLPPVLAVGVESRDHASRWTELCCSEAFTRYLADEVLGWASQQRPITDDPARTIIAGQSLGGLTSVFATQYLPERFGCALAQSGSFWWPGRQEWLTEVVQAIDEPTSGIYLSIGHAEDALMRGAVDRIAKVLTRRGDPLDVHKFYGGHDQACWRADLGNGLAALTARW